MMREANKKPTTLCAQDAKAILNRIDTLLVMLDRAYTEFDDMRRGDMCDAIDTIREATTENDNFMWAIQSLMNGKPYLTPLQYDKDILAQLEEDLRWEQERKEASNDNA